MAKIKVDTTGVETEPEAIKPGLYPAKVKEVELTESQKDKSPMLKVLYEITGGQYDGRVLYDYIMLDNDAMMFRLAAFQDAIGLKRKGEIDTDKIVGKKLQIRTVVQKSEEYGEQARVRNILPPKGKGASDEDLDDEDEDDDDDEVDYNDMTLDELVEELEAREIDVPKKPKKKALIRLLEENDEEEAESEDDEDDEDEAEAESDADGDEDDDEDDDESDEDEDEDEDEDYSEMDLAELKKEVKKRKLEVEGKATKKNLIAALEADDEEDDEDEDEEQDYDEMDLEELKDECKERGLKTAGKKAQLVKRLEKDDKTDDDGEPF